MDGAEPREHRGSGFEIVFPDDRVLRLDITIDTENWTAMQADLAANYGTTTQPGGRPGEEGLTETESDYTPVWGEGTVAFDGAEWKHVGIRYKGNSTLREAVQSGSNKYPFKLDFDEWEESYPEIDDQRFFGFKQLNLGTNMKDETFMREKLANDLHRAFGVASAHTAFCEVYLDVGSGPEWIGVYSLVEEVDDTVHETQFDDPNGNLYKPKTPGASFAAGSYSDADMYAKTNEETTDYSDVRALYDALHSADRESDPTAWRARLEQSFAVEGFLSFLAVNQTIQNWDTYGVMTHNFFLYAQSGVMHWIPWDHNESFLSSGGATGPLSLGLDEVGEEWPLLRFVLDQPEYRSTYEERVQDFLDGPFEESSLAAQISEYETLLSPYAEQETAGFAAAVEQLRQHISDRHLVAGAFL